MMMTEKNHELERAYEFCRNNEFEKAIEIAKSLAQKDNAEAQALLGRLLYDRSSTAEEEKEGIKWLEKSAAKLNQYAIRFLFAHYSNQSQDDDVLRILNPLIQAGDTWAKYQYGYVLFYAKENHEEGIKWMEQAANDGSIQAMLDLSFVYSEEPGYEFMDQKISKSWKKMAFEKTEQTLNPQFVPQLINAYLFGMDEIGIVQDKNKAFSIALKADQKNAEITDTELSIERNMTKLFLARMYQNGWGTEKNLKNAESIYDELAQIDYFKFEVEHYRKFPGAEKFD